MASAPPAKVRTGELVASLQRGRERADDLGRPVLVSVAQPAPQGGTALAVFAGGKGQNARRNFWAGPSRDFWLVGIGSAATLSINDARPLEKARGAHWSLLESAVMSEPGIRGVGPLFMGGFRFDPQAARSILWKDFPDGLLVLPRFLFTFSGDSRWLTINVMIGPGADPEAEAEAACAELGPLVGGSAIPNTAPSIHWEPGTPSEEWAQWVQQALQAIEGGQLTKVVLARKLTAHAEERFSPEAVLHRLSSAYPECVVFALDNGTSSFLGATPEALAHLESGALSLSCLAGSIARGTTQQEDQRLAAQLLASPKDQREHAAVVSMVAENLGGVCEDLRWEATPQVVKLPTVQHLATFFTGRPKVPGDILRLVELLHPTPAVGGVPSHRALEIIRQLEGDRGWYAAPVGWVDHHGEGEFNVAIRSALLAADQATLFAGSGIVQGSDPDLEFKETELKLQPLLAALRGC